MTSCMQLLCDTKLKHVMRGSQWPSNEQVWHLITRCHMCVGLTPTSDTAEGLPQQDPMVLVVLSHMHRPSAYQTRPNT